MRVRLAGENRLHVDSGVVVEQCEDQRQRARVVEHDPAHDVRATVAVEPGIGHLYLGGPGRDAVEQPPEALGDAPHVPVPVAPSPLEAWDVEDAADELRDIGAGRDRKIGPDRGGTLALGFAMVEERVLHRLPHACVQHAARGTDVGEREVGLVAALDQREVMGLDPGPERFVVGDRRHRLAQAARECVHADAVYGEASQAQVERPRGVAPFEGGLGKVGNVARLDVVGVELREDPARGQLGAFVDRIRCPDTVCVLRIRARGIMRARDQLRGPPGSRASCETMRFSARIPLGR